jgi:hypothetical protein
MRPVPPFDPATYPGPRPDGPCLVHDGRVHPASLPEDPSAGPQTPVDAEVADLDAVRWVVAYGSNASPGRLVDKELDARGAWLLPAVLDGWLTVFEDRATRYGSIPLTLVPHPGARLDTWVLGVHHHDVPTLDRTEGRYPAAVVAVDDGRSAPPGVYRLGHVGEVVVADRWRLPEALAYLPGSRTRVQVDGQGAWRTWPASDQAAAAAHVASAGPSREPPPVPTPVTGPWPETPLLACRRASGVAGCAARASDTRR